MDCRALLYRCNRWDCNTCSHKKLYWLREQVLQFKREIVGQKTYFSTLKGFKTARAAKELVTYVIDAEKRIKAPHKPKLEYFYVISKHDFSEWHIHAVTNRDMSGWSEYCKPCRNLRASLLYLVGNLKKSRFEDYEGLRRYSGSSLLYKQSAKKKFKKHKLFQKRRAEVLAVKESNRRAVTMCHCHKVQAVKPSSRQVLQPTIQYRKRHTERPPPALLWVTWDKADYPTTREQ